MSATFLSTRLLPNKLLPLQASASPFGLGAFVDNAGVHFSVYSAHADSMQLCLFDPEGQQEIARLDMPECNDGVWYGLLPDARAGLVYGYRAIGPYEPQLGHRFNPNKLLLDPYARKMVGPLRWHDALYGFNLQSTNADLSFDRQDSAPYMPKAVVVDASYSRFDWGDDRPPRVPWCDTVIYEMHLRGFTRLSEKLPPPLRGTFAGLGHPATIHYLQTLGITTVELLPVQAFVRDRVLVENGLTNYWGYNTLSFFIPEMAYCSTGTLAEIKTAIKQLHAAGIEVILDVVYNHTGEGSELGPTLSLRGLDNASYYRLLDSDPRFYINDTGCGNTLNFSHPRVIQLALDSLRYWVSEFHIDGFRFDLSTTLGREATGFDAGAGFFDALLQDPLLSQVKLIAEPWDLGPGGFQLGNHPARFAEWNAACRDSVRRYWRGNENQRGALAASLQGSAYLFDHDRRKPWASINFVTAHDGFTLQDLVSYNHKHNDANAENNRDGNDHNDSNNWGEEGVSSSVGVIALRDRIKRNLLATLLCCHGTPMLLAGDELGQTQHGNNNAYCQDSPLSWIDWSLLNSDESKAHFEFTQRLLRLRKQWPLLQGHYFQHAQFDLVAAVDVERKTMSPLRDVFWFDERGIELSESDWQNPTARLLGLRRAEIRSDGSNKTNESINILLLLCNADSDAHYFVLPPLPGYMGELPDYRVLFDTSNPAIDNQLLEKNGWLIDAHAMALIGVTYTPVISADKPHSQNAAARQGTEESAS